MISEIIEKHSSIDVLVNVVGGYLGGKSVSELEEQERDIMVNLNLKSAFLISKHVIPIMMSAKYGKMVHVSSRTALKSDGYDCAYAASKSGLIRLIESISQEVKESNINVNCIMPSIIDTVMWLKQQSQIQRGLFCNLSNSLVCSALEYG